LIGKENSGPAERVTRMESCLDASYAAIRDLSEALDRYEEIIDRYEELAAYYGSPEWRADFEAHEAGAFGDLKRGVLSEDAVYDLITEHSELMERLIRAAEYGKSADARSAAAAGNASGHGADEEGQLYE
jgi:hypothetical protein